MAAAAPTSTGPCPGSDDDSHRRVRHPLLASLGRDQRELQRSLGAGVRRTTPRWPPATLPDTLLGWLQADLRADAAAPGGPHPRRRATGRSRCTAATAPPARSQVLREVLLGLLEDDPTLEPRDILVMCPDIENYAPLITAAFGLGDVVEGGHPAHRLRVQLADRALSQTNPLLGVAAQLLDVAGSRATASAVLDLAAEPAGPPPLRLRRRRPRHDGRLGARVRRPLGVRRRPPRSRSASATSRTPGGSGSTGC